MHKLTPLECSRIAQDLQIRKVQVESVVQLLDEGNTVPFITRYRKERTGGLNEEAIRQVLLRVNFLRSLNDRKLTILKTIESQGRLTDELRDAIEKADTTKRLEDLYLPYKPKKRSLAGAAREKGLEPLALAIWYGDPAAAGSLDELFAGLANPDRQLNTADDVRQGVQHILAEMIAETAEVRAGVRRVLWETGKLVSAKSEKLAEGQGFEYKDYFQFTEPARQIPPHRILALNRGEKEGAIRIKMEWDAEQARHVALQALAEQLKAVAGKMPPPAPVPPPAAPAAPQTPAEAPAASETPPGPEAASAPPAEPSAPVSQTVPSDAPQAPEAPAEGTVPNAASDASDAPSTPASTGEAVPASAPAPNAASTDVSAAPLVASLTPSVAAPALPVEPLSPRSDFRSPHVAFHMACLDDALARLLMPSLEREVRHELTDEAETHAVSVFARNLRSLLLQPPLRGRRVLAVDPAFRTGCKLAALDEHGNLLEHTVIYPFGGGPREKKDRRDKKGAGAAPVSAAPPPSAAPAPSADQTTPAEPTPATPAAEASAATPTASTPEPQTVTAPPAADGAPVTGEAHTPPMEATAATASTQSEPQTAEAQTPGPEAPPADAAASDAAAAGAPAAPPAPDRRAEAKAKLHELVTRHTLSVVALGNGTGCRETEELVADLISASLPDLSYVIVNEAGASVYSISQVGREEFPSYDATTRSAISIGRRLQDPLSELVKIDPQSIGVGLYQHDMGRKELKESLEAVIESSVNSVGVDLNTASVPLLRYVSGLNQLVARELVDYRKQHGPFASREQLLGVPNLGATRYTQAAGFLKIPDAANPLDYTWIHPESYALAERLLGELGYGLDVVHDRARREELESKLKSANPVDVAQKLGAGVPTVADIVDALLKPGRDPRDELPPPIFKKNVLRFEDLQPGMELKGTVLNVVDFGAFVDIGLKDSGLVHISQMANRFIKSPYDVVSVNDVVTVWVMNVDRDRRRVSLSMIKPGTERRAPERRPPGERPAQAHGPRPPHQGPRPQQGRGPRRGPQPQGQGAGPGGPPSQGRGPRPPRGRGPARGPQPPHETPAPAAAAPTSEGPPTAEAGRPAQPPRPTPPPPPPRKPRREPPKPKLTKEAIEGKVPLRTFSELSALFATKREESRPRPAEPPPPEQPPSQQPAATEPPSQSLSQPPAEPPSAAPAESPPHAQTPEGNTGSVG
jgi:uncharacterized protein